MLRLKNLSSTIAGTLQAHCCMHAEIRAPRSLTFYAGILFAGYAALAVPSNLVISWVGAKAWLPVLAIIWGVVAAVQAAVRGDEALIALRFFLGAAEAG